MMFPLRDRRITLIGGAGFIGHHLALALARQGAAVSIVDSMQHTICWRLPPKCRNSSARSLSTYHSGAARSLESRPDSRDAYRCARLSWTLSRADGLTRKSSSSLRLSLMPVVRVRTPAHLRQ